MKQIKFRAWDKVLNKWNMSISVDCFGNIQEYKFNGSAFYEKYKSDINEEYESGNERFIISQSTGLYDYEGKEIYEDDIVMLAHWKSQDLFDYSIPFRVKWEYGQVNFKQGEYNNLIGSLVGQLTIKVIGNIYQHPQLLNNGI
jgi:uncharacterized phage protein (TIGR01671 family)